MSPGAGVPARIEEVARLARPVALAGDHVLPVLEAFDPLLPGRGLRRGSMVTVTGSTSLALALVAAASAAGSWCAAVVTGEGSSLGLAAAAELGIVLDRFPLVTVSSLAHSRRERFSRVVVALLDAFEVVLAWPPARLGGSHARRLAARGRERGSTLVIVGDRGPDAGVDLRLSVEGVSWFGIGRGHGRLEARQVEVSATGRGAAGRERRASLWLPAPGGGVALADSGGVCPEQHPVGSVAHGSAG